MSRLESPSSINTYNQCRRKYFYSYKLNLPRKESISTITGKSLHEALENFFKIDPSKISKSDYELPLKHSLMNIFNNAWVKALPSLMKLEDDKEIIKNYYNESIFMLQNFITDYLNSLNQEINGKSFQEAFNKLKPETEIYLNSKNYMVQGFVDAVIKIKDDIYILDYKTGARDEFTDDYKLQLAIYALLFKEKFGITPNKVGLHFLRHGTKKYIDVDEKLLGKAKKECELIHVNTASEDIKDYDKNPGYWCKWRNGQCSFYDLCFGVKTLDQYDEKLIQINKNE